MGPDSDQANVLLLTFKTKIEEAISLVNQMPEDLRQDAWHFWQKVSSAVMEATVGLKKRKCVPGGKDIVQQTLDKPAKKKEVLEEVEEDVVEEFVIDSPAMISQTIPVSEIPSVIGQDSLAQDLKLLYHSVYTKETADAVQAMINQDSPSVFTVKDAIVTTSGPVVSEQHVNSAINVVVQDIVNDQVITSLVTIDKPDSPLKKPGEKNSPKKKSTKRANTKRKAKKTSIKNEGKDETDITTSDQEHKHNQPKRKKSSKNEASLKQSLVPVGEDIVSLALAENVVLPESENINSDIKTDTETEVGETPLAENKSSNTKRKPRRSTRPPKPKKLPLDQEDIEGGLEGTENQKRRRRVYQPGEAKPELGPVDCPVCGLKLAYISSLPAHMRKHTGDRPFICSICSKQFTTKANMLRHEKTHSGEKPFQCEICQKCFTEKKTLKVHMRSHTGERPFKCTECGMGFSQSGTLKSHMHRHSGHKGNLCDLCGRAFRQKSQLRIHLKRHFNLKSYKCDKCDQTFYCKGDLSRHEMKHSGERPFACTQCPKTFTRLQYLKEHENHHNGVTPYNCNTCNMGFSDHSSYYRHMQKHKRAQAADNAEESVHLVVDSEAMENETVDSVPALLVTADHIQHLFGVNSGHSSEVYRIALVDHPMDEDAQTIQEVNQADFSAINLLASATTQLSMSQDPETETDLKQIEIPTLLN